MKGEKCNTYNIIQKKCVMHGEKQMRRTIKRVAVYQDHPS